MGVYCASLQNCRSSLETMQISIPMQGSNIHPQTYTLWGNSFFQQLWIGDMAHLIYKYLLICLPMTHGLGVVVAH